jgi:glycogen debranching enzyme
MDARCDNITFTSRVGKPVEVQALWYNALVIAGKIQKKWNVVAKSMSMAFEDRFWNPERSILYDVIDVDNQEGCSDGSFRPNQLLAIGGLPHQLLTGAKAQMVVEACQRELLTPFGMRTLDPTDSRFAPKYVGNNFQRDSSYHQGTVWPWLIGPFVEAWLRVNGDTPENRKSAKELFLSDLIASVYERDGVGHIGEIHDGTLPFKGRGCPFQAWSVTEVLRLVYDVLAP